MSLVLGLHRTRHAILMSHLSVHQNHRCVVRTLLFRSDHVVTPRETWILFALGPLLLQEVARAPGSEHVRNEP
jgi:hypothetical protein